MISNHLDKLLLYFLLLLEFNPKALHAKGAGFPDTVSKPLEIQFWSLNITTKVITL